MSNDSEVLYFREKMHRFHSDCADKSKLFQTEGSGVRSTPASIHVQCSVDFMSLCRNNHLSSVCMSNFVKRQQLFGAF